MKREIRYLRKLYVVDSSEEEKELLEAITTNPLGARLSQFLM
jgi:hypothetical protein